MVKPYPLLFKPELKERIWGGQALSRYGIVLPDALIGEGWMIADHPNGTTKVVNGELSGWGLDRIRVKYGNLFFGEKESALGNDRFPLLIKLLDCEDDLSVQVHPDDDYIGLPAGESGKTEMWYILDAKPGAKIICGLKENVTRETLAEAIVNGTIMDCLLEVPATAGDSLYIPAGTVHALCSGVFVAEIQQNSDTTYRLYDYDRLGLDGQKRKLHVDDSLNVISFEGSGAIQMKTDLTAPNQWLTLACSPYFVVEKGRVAKQWDLQSVEESFTVLVICSGNGSIRWSEDVGGSSLSMSLKAGMCLLLPAALGSYTLEGEMTVLRSYLP